MKEVFKPPLGRGPWQLVSSESRYENPWIEVLHQEVITPGNTEGIYGLVHFKGSAVGIVAIDADEHIYLVGQYRYTLNQYSWEIPMGGCAAGDKPLLAAQRELEEETGMRAKLWQHLQVLHTSNSICDEKGDVFLATDLFAGTQMLEASEDITVKRIPLADAVAMVLASEITDAISVAAILQVALQRATKTLTTE
jgi:8-oxo-dGTP pyrophosphatase MutT (NUDIX family)